ncbi:putative efflux protein, MATE family [Marinospirillum celere]|uniref:Putative efflux protein, MATE family n=1 Tax=Marinospirillum celere TaxID=1122252 RepID=A0A1I1H3G7_9GAMM|nr:MATE family efflux transporter [Marinospirillum celere]SFC16648.1 putative efflux protein, MATE family [Marinospirillum celere]
MNTEHIKKIGFGRTLYQMTWPMLFGVLALMSYQLVDAAWIALLGVDPLAALGFTLPVQQLIIGFQVGLGIATTAIISRTLGAGNPEKAQQQGRLILITGLSLLALLMLFLWLLRPLILNFLGADAELRPLIDRYWAPWLLSAWLGAGVYLGYSQHRAQGDTKFPGLMMLVVSLLNLVLDPLFIFTFGWGLPGAAWATVVAFAFGGLMTYPRIFKKGWISPNLQGLAIIQELRALFGTALPAMLSQLMPAFSAILATSLVAGFGTVAVAAWGLGTRLEFFSIVVVLALTMSLPPILGRFAGAGDWDSVERLLKLAVGFVIVWQLGIALVWMLVSQPLVNLITEEAAVSELVQEYLFKLPISYAALGVCMLMVSANNAVGMPLRGLMTSLVRLFACYLPCLWLGAQLAGISGLFTGALIGNFLAGTLAWLMYRQGLNQLRQQRLGELRQQ